MANRHYQDKAIVLRRQMQKVIRKAAKAKGIRVIDRLAKKYYALELEYKKVTRPLEAH